MRRDFIHFKGRDSYETREIRSLCPLNMKVTAVFFDSDDNTLFRSPQLALAVYDTVSKSFGSHKELERERGGVGFINSVEGGDEFADVDCCNFLGFEYGDEQHDWTDAIKSLKVRRAGEERTAVIRSIQSNLENRGTGQLLDEARGCLDNGELIVQSKSQNTLDWLSKPEHIAEITKATKKVTGEDVTVKLELWEKRKPVTQP